MKTALTNSISVVMAVLVLFSTFSFTVQKHYCGDFLIDTAVFSKAESCGMDVEKDHKSHSLMNSSACNNKKVEVEGQKDLKISFEHFDLPQQVFLTTFIYTYFDLFEPAPEQITPFKDYSPPLLVSDIQLQDQVFLI